jgi:hypothetical protein
MRSPLRAIAARHFVFICRADATAGGADLFPSRRALGRQLDHAVVRQNHLGAVGNEQIPVDAETQLAQPRNLFEEGDRIQNHAIANHALASRAEHSAGNELQHETLAANDDRVTGIVPAGIARHGAEALAQHVHNLALALVAPLGAHYHCSLGSHGISWNLSFGKTRVTVNYLRSSGSPLPVGRGDLAVLAPVHIDSGFAIARRTCSAQTPRGVLRSTCLARKTKAQLPAPCANFDHKPSGAGGRSSPGISGSSQRASKSASQQVGEPANGKFKWSGVGLWLKTR